MSKGMMDDDDGTSRGVIRPAPPAHIRTITTSGHITTVPNIDGQARNNDSNAPPPDTMSQLKAQQHGDFVHDG